MQKQQPPMGASPGGFSWDPTASRGHAGVTDSRDRFLAKTYHHLFLSILAFAGIELALFYTGLAERIVVAIQGTSWLLIMGAFVLVSFVASHVSLRAASKPAQYAALFGFVLAEAIVFVPLLYIANAVAPGAIASAALVTILGFAALTALVLITKKDFSFLGSLVKWGGIVALITVVAGVIFGFQLGTFFSVAMVGLAGAAILYDTSNILRVFPEDRYVAAALQLFSSVALMFWYVLRLFLSARR